MLREQKQQKMSNMNQERTEIEFISQFFENPENSLQRQGSFTIQECALKIFVKMGVLSFMRE